VAERATRGPGGSRLGAAAAAALLLGGLVAEFWFPPLEMDRFETGGRVPAVYRWLAAQPHDGAVLEVPWAVDQSVNRDPAWRSRYALFGRAMEATDWGINLADWITRLRYLYFSTYHWHPLVNGYSGYTPPSYERIVHRLRGFPRGGTIDYLASIGVRWVVVHPELLSAVEAAEWRAFDPRQVGLTEVGRFESAVVYEIPRP
jgi:hypothetical protein